MIPVYSDEGQGSRGTKGLAQEHSVRGHQDANPDPPLSTPNSSTAAREGHILFANRAVRHMGTVQLWVPCNSLGGSHSHLQCPEDCGLFLFSLN